MSFNTSVHAYPDIIKILDRALASTKGVRLHFTNAGEALQFVQRIHSYRSIDRKNNAKTYPADHPLHGRSVYDGLGCRRKPDHSVEVLKFEGIEFNGEEIV